MGRQSAADQECCGERRGPTHRQGGDCYPRGRREEESGCSRFQDSRERPLGMRFPSEPSDNNGTSRQAQRETHEL